jgi:Domain of unknown function (DUF397)
MEEPTAVNPGWRKSSYSSNGGAQCVEVGATPWRKSSHSNGGAANCVEAAHLRGAVLIRDTKDNGTGPVLRVTPVGWRRFTSRVRAATSLG